MALSQIYSAIAGDIITAARWNNEFSNLYQNGTDVAFPVTKAVSFAGFTLTLDAAGVTTLTSTASTGYAFIIGSKTGTPSASGTLGVFGNSTFTDTNTAASGTASLYTGLSVKTPTLAASNLSVTTTNAATVYIEAAPIAGTNETITNPWALWIDSGNVRFDNDIYWLSGTAFNGIFGHNNSGHRTYTFQDSDDTIVGRATTDTLTNKTLTTPVINGTITGTYTLGGTPTVPASAGSSMVYIETLDLSSSTIIQNLSAAYTVHVFVLVSVKSSSNAQTLEMFFSSNNGSTFANSSYSWSQNGVTTDSDTRLNLAGNVTATASFGGINGTIRLFNVGSIVVRKHYTGEVSCHTATTGVFIHNTVAGSCGDASPDVVTTAVNAIKLEMTAGTTSGTVLHYGIKNS